MLSCKQNTACMIKTSKLVQRQFYNETTGALENEFKS